MEIGNISERVIFTPLQSKVFQAYTSGKYRFISCCFGRRSGKTILDAVIMNYAATVNMDGTPATKKNIWYITDTREHAEDLIWEELKAIVPKQNLAKAPENQNLRIKYKNGSEIRLKSGDNPDALVGKGLDLLIIDEAALVKPEVWGKVLPTLADKKGMCMITSTPRGMDNWFYDVHHHADRVKAVLDEYGKETGEYAKKFPDWVRFDATTAEAGIVTEDEIEMQKEIMDPRTYQEEFLASFLNASGKIYYAFDRDDSVTEKAVDDGKSPLFIGMDFNVDPMCAVVAIKKDNGLHVIDEICIPDSNTPEMSMEINNRYKGRQVYVCPDASGSRRDTRSYRQDTSDHQILKTDGYKLLVNSKNPAVVDRIASVNALFLNADGKRRLYVHPKCERVIQSLNRHTYKAGTRIPNKDGWDHMNDAIGYLVYQTFPINPPRKKKVRVRNIGIV